MLLFDPRQSVRWPFPVQLLGWSMRCGTSGVTRRERSLPARYRRRGRFTFCRLMLLAALLRLDLLRRRGFLSRRLDGSGVDNSGLRDRSSLDLLGRRGFLNRRLGGSGTDDPGLRSRSVANLWRRRFDFLPLRRGLLRRGLLCGGMSRRGAQDLGLRSRGRLNLRWRQFGFLIGRGHVQFRSRFGSRYRLNTGRRHWRWLGGGDLRRRRFYLGSRFRSCHAGRFVAWRRSRIWRHQVRWTTVRSRLWGRCRLLLLSWRCAGLRSR